MNSFAKIICALLLAATAAGARDAFPPASDLPVQTGLPNPLVMFDGHPVATKEEWFARRRPELKALFEYYMYGKLPPPAAVTATTGYVNTNAFNGKATLKVVTLALGPSRMPRVQLLLVVPNHRRRPAPVFLGMNFSGNHSLVTDPHVPPPDSWMPSKLPGVTDHHGDEAGRGKFVKVWNIEQTIDRGYAVATYYCGDMEPDSTNAQGGVRELIHVPDGPHDWGTIAAWAWGMQRVVDYLVTNPDVDKTKIALVGHSRFGKATVLAGAFDDRVAMIIPLQAGCGGTAPSRGVIGESVKRINTSFPHWFCGEFKAFNDDPARLPFDQHCLIALCAPRPVLLGAATGDTWSNPSGAFDMLRAADGVYRFLGADGLDATTLPPKNKLIDSTLGYFIRPGNHSMTTLDWKFFLEFADKHFGKPE